MNSKKGRQCFNGISAAFAAFAAIAICSAEPIQELPPVHVVAEKRQSVLQRVPMSISIIDQKQLQNHEIGSLRDVSLYVPNLYLSSLTARRTAFPFMRGLGSGQGEPVVTTYIDGVPQLTPNSIDIEFLDLQRIEVLRGPQGTLYGRNTLGGVIHLITRQPTDNRTSGGLTIGEFGLQRYDLSVARVVDDQTAFGLGGVYSVRDGFTKNIDGTDIDERETTFGRAQLLLTPSEDLEITLSVYAQADRDGDYVLADLDGLRQEPHRIAHDFVGYTDRDVVSPSVTINSIGTNVDFTSISSFTSWSAEEATDIDFANDPVNTMTRHVEEDQSQLFQELRLSSSQDVPVDLGFATMHWLAGVSAFSSELNHESETFANTLFTGGVDATDRADFELDDYGFGVFGHLTFTLSERLELGTGLRYTHENKSTDISLSSEATAFVPALGQLDSFSDSFEDLLPRVTLSYQSADNIRTYVAAAKGFRPGGYNRSLSPLGPLEFDEEESWTYEAGIKSTWLDNRLRVNAAVFYVDWDDMQLDVPNPVMPGRFMLDNIGEARSQGFECDIAARLDEHWEISAGVGVTDAIFTEYTDLSGVDVSGNNLPNVPAFTWNAALRREQDHANGLRSWLGTELTGVGELPFDSLNARQQNDYALINLRAGVGRDIWRLETWVRNVFDEEYIVAAISPPSAPFTPSGYAGRSGEPRMAGVSLSFEM